LRLEEEEERIWEGQRHPSRATKNKTETREIPVAFELVFLSKREKKRTKTKPRRGRRRLENFSLPISFDPKGPHLVRDA